ncbi:MAG TPA: DNA replication and repair protein RecF [Lentimicrobium sp.]|nr:DNA replication and repair protein RecF [Lentimicrobium sp.]
MFLKFLQLYNFKNYAENAFTFSDRINCFIGDNGEGKTNVLDAIYYLSFTKSYFNLLDNQNIRHGEDFFAIHGKFSRNNDLLDEVSCIQRRNSKKQFRINGKDYDRLANHIGEFPLVMVSPYDRDLINEGSDIRRKYIDSVISQFDRFYLDDLIIYNKALIQRNALLKHFNEKKYFDEAAIEIYQQQMEQPAQRIFSKRIEFLKGFIPVFRHYFDFISNRKETVDIEYHSHLSELSLADIFYKNRDRDVTMRYTTGGIHKDDMDFMIDGLLVKKFGSQGQQKSFLIALKLAQFEYTKKIKGYKPILLFDDIFDKLDFKRVSQIINLVSENSFGQVFITDTQPERIRMIFKQSEQDHLIFKVLNGNASLQNEIE